MSFNFSPVPSIITDALGTASRFNKFVNNFNPSSARLAAANLVKGGVSTALSGVAAKASGAIGGAIGGAVGGAVGGAFSGAIGSAVGGAVGSGLNGVLSGSISNVLGADNLTRPITPGLPPQIEFRSSLDQQTGKTSAAEEDWRIKIECPAFAATAIFPVLPSVTFNYAATYSSQRLTHSNYASHFYDSSEVREIQITGDFPVQHDVDGFVLLNTINFFKATTKMYFGTGENAGNPPPIVFLHGYGKPFLSRIPCVVVAFQHTMPNDVDYVKCNDVRLPTISQLLVTLQPVISRANAGNFNLNNYAMGNLPGFI